MPPARKRERENPPSPLRYRRLLSLSFSPSLASQRSRSLRSASQPPRRSPSIRVSRAPHARLSLSLLRKAVPRRRDVTLNGACGWSRFSSLIGVAECAVLTARVCISLSVARISADLSDLFRIRASPLFRVSSLPRARKGKRATASDIPRARGTRKGEKEERAFSAIFETPRSLAKACPSRPAEGRGG